MKSEFFPYDSIASYQSWRSAVTDVANRAGIDPQGPPKFRLAPETKIASAGSCFAERIAERLPAYGMHYLVTERGAEPLSARYGNIYTAPQLTQLAERAFGYFDPLERAWRTPAGRYIDPFRPRVQRDGFATVEELEADRASHLAAVREMFLTLDVFVFTVGLTEIWSDRRDGAVFPACPGRGYGTFDADRHVWSNLTVDEICESFERFLQLLSRVNQRAKVILTVSPVPIAATLQPTPIIRASMLCKSTLKVASETTARRHANVDYFASYDMVIQNVGAAAFFEKDGRHIKPCAVNQVVDLFVRNYFAEIPAAAKRKARTSVAAPETHEINRPCDEDELLERIHSEHLGRGPDSVGQLRASRPLPVYFLGDSNTLVFNNLLASGHDGETTYIARAIYAAALYASDLCTDSGELNKWVLSGLVRDLILIADGAGGWKAFSRDMNDQVDSSIRADSPLVLCCGMLDCLLFLGHRCAGIFCLRRFTSASGWYALEESADGSPFRWVNNGAEIIVTYSTLRSLEFDVEAGPGSDRGAFTLRVLTADGEEIHAQSICNREHVAFRLPARAVPYTLVLGAVGGGGMLIGDSRILNFRVIAAHH
jgi:hypothetical protein